MRARRPVKAADLGHSVNSSSADRSNKTSPNKMVLTPGALLLLPPSWIVYNGVQELAGVPPLVALCTVAGLVGISAILIFQGLRSLEEGDVKDAKIQFGIAGLILFAEFVAQWGFAITENHPLVTALILSMLSFGGAVIVESEIMRVWKAKSRESHAMMLARPRCPSDVRKFYPDVAKSFDLIAVRHPDGTQKSILALAFAEHDRHLAAPVPVQVRVDVTSLPGQTSGQPAIASGQNPDASGQPEPGPAASGSLAEQVRAAIAAGARTYPDVLAEIVRANPGANPDSVRRALSKELKLKSLKSA